MLKGQIKTIIFILTVLNSIKSLKNGEDPAFQQRQKEFAQMPVDYQAQIREKARIANETMHERVKKPLYLDEQGLKDLIAKREQERIEMLRQNDIKQKPIYDEIAKRQAENDKFWEDREKARQNENKQIDLEYNNAQLDNMLKMADLEKKREFVTDQLKQKHAKQREQIKKNNEEELRIINGGGVNQFSNYGTGQYVSGGQRYTSGGQRYTTGGQNTYKYRMII